MPRGEVEARVRAICMALPAVTEKLSHGAPAFFAGKQFVACWTHGHHDDRFAHLWCAAPPGALEALIAEDPERYFRPPYVGGRGWIGVRLDGDVDWDDVRTLCEEAYRSVASPKLSILLDHPGAAERQEEARRQPER